MNNFKEDVVWFALVAAGLGFTTVCLFVSVAVGLKLFEMILQ
jgi:hypothetical protein